jgi:hypothetical protein
LPLAVGGASLHYGGDELRVRGLAGSAGRSSVRNGSIEVILGRAPALRSASADYVLLLDEIFPLLHSPDASRPALAGLAALQPALADLQGVTGTARVRLARASGPLARPPALDFEAEIELEQVRIEAAALPAPLILSAGAGALTPRALTLKRLALAAADTRITVSGTVRDYATAGRRADLELSEGTIGRRGLDWIHARLGLPADAMVRAPVAISTMRVQWPGPAPDPLVAQGRIRVADAVDADFDLAWESGNLDLKRLALKDADTDVTAALLWKPGTVEVSFAGAFDARTLARMLEHAPAGRGAMHGDFHAEVDMREPQRSRATGTAEGRGIDLTRQFGAPVTVERFRLEAAEHTLRVHEGSTIVISSQPLELSGSVEAREDTLAIDARLKAKALDARKLLELVAPGSGSGKSRLPASMRWDLPFSGRIALESESVAVAGQVFEQVEGSVELARHRVTAEVTRARLCGVVLPFTVAMTPDGVEAKLQLRARAQPLGETLSCVTAGRLAATGTYDLDAELTASGPVGELRNAARGTFEFKAREGRIQRDAILSRALAIDEVATRLDEPPPKLLAEGLDYAEFAAAGSLESGFVRLDHGVLDSGKVEIAIRGDIALADGGLELQGLVAPLGTMLRAARRVPVLGRAVGATLIVVPVSITGNVRDPEVKVLSAAAVGTTLVNLMSARFLLPIHLLDIAGGMVPRNP